MNKDISKKLMLTAGVKTADWKTYNLNSLELHNELCEMIVQETIKKMIRGIMPYVRKSNGIIPPTCPSHSATSTP